jgi:hypothetical protein
MPLYFFDTRDGDMLVPDDDGAELPDLAAAKAVASASLAELARDVLPSSERRVLIVEVQDEERAVLETRLTFEAILLVQ